MYVSYLFAGGPAIKSLALYAKYTASLADAAALGPPLRHARNWSSGLHPTDPASPSFARHNGRVNLLMNDGSVRTNMNPDLINPDIPANRKLWWGER